MNDQETENIIIESEEPKKPHLNLETATLFANSVRRSLCKNATVEAIDTGKDEEIEKRSGNKIIERSYDIRGDGCRNERRNGSAFCQDCSDKHKKENESK